jgi:hypothetical protein
MGKINGKTEYRRVFVTASLVDLVEQIARDEQLDDAELLESLIAHGLAARSYPPESTPVAGDIGEEADGANRQRSVNRKTCLDFISR